MRARTFDTILYAREQREIRAPPTFPAPQGEGAECSGFRCLALFPVLLPMSPESLEPLMGRLSEPTLKKS